MWRLRCGEPNPAAGKGPQHERGTIVPGVSLFGRHVVALCGLATRKNRRFPAPKGPEQISPGQRPGCVIRRYSVALKGHNGLAASAVCAALSGLGQRVADPTQGVALGWYVAAPSGREEKDATIERVCRATRGRLNCRDHLGHGLTLLELVVVLSILAVLALVAVKSLEPVADQARYDATQRTLTEIRDAMIVVTQTSSSNGTPLIGGFISDIGRLPVSVAELASPVSLSLSAFPREYDFDSNDDGTVDANFWGGWRGPYLRPPIGVAFDDIRDGYGRELHFIGPNAGAIEVRSLGADGLLDDPANPPTGYDRDLSFTLTKSDYQAVVQLQVAKTGATVTGLKLRVGVRLFRVTEADVVASELVWAGAVTGTSSDDLFPAGGMSSPMWAGSAALQAVLWDDANENSLIDSGETAQRSVLEYVTILPPFSALPIKFEIR